jgi:SAM-dependent methyltransferase
MVAANFDPEAAVRYWRHLPSGLGKHDTLQMAELNPNDLARHWDAAFRARVYTYPEEEQFLRIMTTRFAGRRVTSVGSGLGFQELVYAKHGAHVRCIDVVHSNLTVVRRVAQLKGLEVETLLVNDLNNPVYGQPNSQDVVLFYGSLMTMPTPLQARATNEAFRLLKERGAVIFMLYTWEFARHSCG